MGIEDTDIKDNGNAGCSSMLYSKTHKFADGTPKYSVAWISFIVIFTQIINGGNQIILSAAFSKSNVDVFLVALLRMVIAVCKISGASTEYPKEVRTRSKIIGWIVTPLIVMTYFFGLSMTNAVNAAALAPSQPVFTTMAMVALGRERFSLVKFSFILVTIVGCLTLVLWDSGDKASGGSNLLLGNIFLIANVIMATVQQVGQQPIVKVMNPSFFSVKLFYYSSYVFLGCTAFRWYQTGDELYEPLYGSYWLLLWGALLYMSFLSTAVVWPLHAIAIKHTSPTLLASFNPAMPLTTSLLSIVFLSIAPTMGQLIGGSLIIVGLWGVLASKSTEVKPITASLSTDSIEMRDIIVASHYHADAAVAVVITTPEVQHDN